MKRSSEIDDWWAAMRTDAKTLREVRGIGRWLDAVKGLLLAQSEVLAEENRR